MIKLCTGGLCDNLMMLIMILVIENRILMKINSNCKQISTPIKVLMSMMTVILLKLIQNYYHFMSMMMMKVNLTISNSNKIVN